MEELRKRPGPKTKEGEKEGKKEKRGMNSVVMDPKQVSLKAKVILYSLVLLKVALWLVFAWALSYLHLGAPCFLLAVILWVYVEPLQRAFDWAKRHFCPFSRAQEKNT